MKFIKLIVADETIHHFDDDRNDFVVPRHSIIIIPIENIIEVTELEKQDSDKGITEIVVKYNNGTSDYIVEESVNDIYRMLEK